MQVTTSSPYGYVAITSGKTDYINHNSDGSKAVLFRACIDASSYGISAEISGAFELTTIPRASSISCTTANIGETAIITINSAVDNWVHDVYARFGNNEKCILSGVKGGTHSWTIPEEYYLQIPNSKSGKGAISINTFNGDVEIGTKTIEFTVTTNETECKPTLSATIIDINEKTVGLTGNKNKLVKYKSTVKIQIATTAKNNASISTKKINEQVVENNTINIEKVENNSFTIEVIDSRGYSNSATITKEMINYIPLTINANAKRKNPTSSEVFIDLSGNYFNSNFGTIDNTIQISWKYKNKNETEYINGGTIQTTVKDNTYSNSSISLGELFDYQNAYDIQIIGKDKLTTVETVLTITQGIPIINWGKDFFNVNGRLLINGENILEEQINSPDIVFDENNIITITPFVGINQDNWGGSYYYKQGTKVHLHLGLNLKTDVRSQVFNMPTGFRPKGVICGIGGGASGEIPDISCLEVYSNGKVWVKSTSKYACIDIEYDAFN